MNHQIIHFESDIFRYLSVMEILIDQLARTPFRIQLDKGFVRQIDQSDVALVVQPITRRADHHRGLTGQHPGGHLRRRAADKLGEGKIEVAGSHALDQRRRIARNQPDLDIGKSIVKGGHAAPAGQARRKSLDAANRKPTAAQFLHLGDHAAGISGCGHRPTRLCQERPAYRREHDSTGRTEKQQGTRLFLRRFDRRQ
ncbi:MAG TPA: hypothetical protein PLD10_03175 [Rhodopila sp.]|nr:hypothetical protein [Rhodopila sp.]